jgi:hypothetical protein
MTRRPTQRQRTKLPPHNTLTTPLSQIAASGPRQAKVDRHLRTLPHNRPNPVPSAISSQPQISMQLFAFNPPGKRNFNQAFGQTYPKGTRKDFLKVLEKHRH